MSVGDVPGDPVSASRLESYVGRAVLDQTGQRVDGVSCPGELTADEGESTSCTATYDDVAIRARATVESVTDDKPRLSASTSGKPVDEDPPALSASVISTVFTEKYEALRPVDVRKLSCFPLRARVGAESHCVVTVARRGQGERPEPHLVTLSATAVEGTHVDFDFDVDPSALR